MNCLAYALEFWSINKSYDIFYDGNHVVNLEVGYVMSGSAMQLFQATGMLSMKGAYSYDQISASFAGLLTEPQEKLLREYFGLND